MNFSSFFKIATAVIITITAISFSSCSEDSKELISNNPHLKVTNEEMISSFRYQKAYVQEIPNYTDTLTGMRGTLFKFKGVTKAAGYESWLISEQSITDKQLQELANNDNVVRTGTTIEAEPDEEGNIRWTCQGEFSDCVVICGRWAFKW